MKKKNSKKNENFQKNILLWDKIARPHRKPFGLFYPLETSFSSNFFHRTLHPCKINSVKNN